MTQEKKNKKIVLYIKAHKEVKRRELISIKVFIAFLKLSELLMILISEGNELHTLIACTKNNLEEFK